ncbi:myo-inositol-1-phosphate synthase [Actinopolyspora erythraea]|uniref:Myo-inositol-1-phosphate synthase n=1 Tax=Actinopolyspora erythraea TaxID=414996 RepID=A0A099D5Y9_9ACTN|nr:inositol-3-phosphate synthase [Actinopolyspora erythraea]ASU78779.1 myo-inositol-1-phosphate synthase [Actinopolyspora erythraea]KGI81533.1 hypothetical protein IL38_11445 [Actinopolyspora erythraea]
MTTSDNEGRTGVWLVGARGSVATTAITGAAALRDRLIPTTGCVTESPELLDEGMPGFDSLVFAGHDITETPLPKRAEQLEAAGILPRGVRELVHTDLAATDQRIRRGVGSEEAGHGQLETAERLIEQLCSFRELYGLSRVVVINVAATEAHPPGRNEHTGLEELEHGLRRSDPDGGAVLPPSSLYAYAALRAGCPYADFTPSVGARLPALDELAARRGVPYAGSDGKTGETLVKSALLPMFSSRALRVHSWSGTNLLGGGDGRNLADPDNVTSKTTSKQRAAHESLGYPVDGEVHIDYVSALGEWKTAWDHISFEGFLDNRMTMQFTWQGCDSALAAPLVLDLARLLARAHERGHSGPLSQLGFFFKDPVASDEHRLVAQFETLRTFVRRLREGQ